jgi:hypothetical protein
MQNLMRFFGLTLVLALTTAGCAAVTDSQSRWVTLLDGDKGLENFIVQGDANWRAEDGVIMADQGKGGYLVTKSSYTDFIIRAEFWAASNTNSGIFIRATDPNKIAADTSYEVNVWDQRPDPIYSTGGIVNYAAVPVPPIFKAGERWNVFEIEALGPEVTIKLNDVITTKMNNSKFASGPFALQFGVGLQGAVSGPIKWRKVQVRAL